MTDRTRKCLIASIAISAACVAAIIAVCVLLFSGRSAQTRIEHIVIDTDDAVQAKGELAPKLVRERLTARTIDKRGYPVDSVSDTPRDFTRPSGDNIFGIESNMLVGPGCGFTAEMAISNTRPYAFAYWLEITLPSGDSAAASQMEFAVWADGEPVQKSTSEDGLVTVPIRCESETHMSRFTVTLTYLDVADNDATQNKEFAFDMVVHTKLI